ncbi:E3 ubiquitin-protein ligase ATL42 [Ricinus communis]|uniref:RING-type E3 ubiquitin transferase n=1 Tax=Ricinus communis TaxID=3988 RepID=B9RS17_RICCO|nr:E3 ubiquitin-protein ligase ATL42 [Ricinus communis]EEF45877.1 ring finger protein, putative [Ricinus communis]|eukprot:XP_002516536.1 E3 ubiquitin-protein ligase ATL42 [Ricinus communis]
MSQLGVLLIILCLLFFPVKAQNISDSDQSGVLRPLQPSLAVVIGIISVMLSVTFLILAYAKFCRRNLTDNHLSHDTNHQGFTLVRSRSRLSGIDREVIDSLPFFRFSSLKGSKEGLECAVCLSRFEDIEILRLLPKCKHAFHKNCIDQWLESHSSCPLCRYKFDPNELKSFRYSNSLRYSQTPSNLADDPNLELFIHREQDYQGSSTFNLGKGKKEELLSQEGHNKKFLHKFKHKIIVSDVIIKNRWSDFNSSDLLSMSSEMLNVMSSNMFSHSDSTNGRSYNNLSMNEHIEKIKEDIERKRLCESKLTKAEGSDSFSASCFPSTSYKGESSLKMINPGEKRSISEITVCSRFNGSSLKNKIRESASPRSSEREDRTRRLWFPIAQRTVQWFADGQELECRRQRSSV